jgi:hypothetical protein
VRAFKSACFLNCPKLWALHTKWKIAKYVFTHIGIHKGLWGLKSMDFNDQTDFSVWVIFTFLSINIIHYFERSAKASVS